MPTIQTRAGRDGKSAFQVRVRLLGHPEHVETFTRKTDAKTWGADLESSIRLGRCIECAKLGQTWTRISLSEIAASYEASPEFARLSSTSQSTARYALAFLKRYWGEEKRVGDLSVELIHKLQEERQQHGIGGSWINRTVTYLNVALRHAMRIGKLPHNPIAGFQRLKENKRRERTLTEAEHQALLDKLPSHLKPAFELNFYLPFRCSELWQLTWNQVDLGNACVRFEAGVSKSGRPRVIPLRYPHLVSMLAALPSRFAAGRVFLGQRGEPIETFPRRDWERARTQAAAELRSQGIETDLDTVRWHDLKRTAISELAMQPDIPAAALQHMADQKGPIISASYQKPREDQVLKSVPLMDPVTQRSGSEVPNEVRGPTKPKP